ncbi:MAG TPA: PAS domain S-box protein, partial [Gammaproteobacteria bacterium]|nr:PAS domain S-box protein [Gammaproteobacteria bacterium]
MRTTKDSAEEKSEVRAALALSETGFQTLVDSVRDYAIFMLDPQGIVVSWNAGAERINGYSIGEILGRHFKIFYLPEERDSGQPELELKTARETGRYEDESWRIRKDGSRFRAHVVVTAIRNAAGELLGYAKVTQDVTERWEAEQELRQSERRFRILVEQVRDYAIFMLSPEGRVATWNLGAQRIEGYEASEVVGRHVGMFFPPEDAARGKPAKLLQQADAEGVARDHGWRIRKDGSRFWADVTLTALRDANGSLYGYVKVIRDLTERVEAEELAQAYAAAREAVRARDEFLSIASHELRTPLAAAHLQLQSLKRLLGSGDGGAALDQQSVSAAVDRALGSTARLSQLVDTLLDVSRITSGRIQLHLSTFDLADVVRETVDRLT